MGGAGCRHFRSSPSLLSTCCCVGPAGTGRARQPPRRLDLGPSRRADPYPALPAARLCAPVRRCATSLLGPLVIVYMVRRAARRDARTHALASPARGQVPRPPPELAQGWCRGRGPFNRRPGTAGRGRARYTPPALKGPAQLRPASGHEAEAVLRRFRKLTRPGAVRPAGKNKRPAPHGPRPRQRQWDGT